MTNVSPEFTVMKGVKKNAITLVYRCMDCGKLINMRVIPNPFEESKVLKGINDSIHRAAMHKHWPKLCRMWKEKYPMDYIPHNMKKFYHGQDLPEIKT